jgi:hypothetical protein
MEGREVPTSLSLSAANIQLTKAVKASGPDREGRSSLISDLPPCEERFQASPGGSG